MRVRVVLAAVVALLVVAVVGLGTVTVKRLRSSLPARSVGDEPGAIPAAFARRSYAPGEKATHHSTRR